MPELPEVETVRRGLALALAGRTLEQVEIRDGRLTAPADPNAVAHALHGAGVTGVGRRGKYLVLGLDDGSQLVCHLRMTGWFHHVTEPAERPHLRALFGLDDGSWLLYSDQRRFGTMRLLAPGEQESYWRGRLGPEPLAPEWTPADLRQALRGRRAPIKALLLDQRVVAGVGNIYADEALFRAGIHPLRPAGALTRPQLHALRDGIEQALSAGIEAKGATIDDFRHVDGARGSFQDRFLVHLREGEPCLTCGTTIRKLVVGGRGTYVCEHCQPRPRRRTGRDPARTGRDPARTGRDPARPDAAQAASSSGSLPARSAASSS
jgi:formamidopyrimidine-DNA glycosylase